MQVQMMLDSSTSISMDNVTPCRSQVDTAHNFFTFDGDELLDLCGRV